MKNIFALCVSLFLLNGAAWAVVDKPANVAMCVGRNGSNGLSRMAGYTG